jgi:hypothetical protein
MADRTIQPITGSAGAGWLKARITVSKTDGSVLWSQDLLLDNTDTYNSIARPPLVQASEFRFPQSVADKLAPGTYDVTVSILKGGGTLDYKTNAVNVTWELLKR